MDPITVATSVAGLLGLTIQVSQMVYEQVHTLKNATKDAAKLLEELQLLCQVLTSLEQFLASRLSKGCPFKETSVFIKAIGGCNTQISIIKIRLDKLVRKQGVAQIIERGRWYFEHDEHQQLIQTLHRYIGIFQVSLSIDGMANEGSELLSKSMDDVTQQIQSIKSAISTLTYNPQEAEANSRQLDNILNLLLPLSNVSEDILQVTKTFQRWDLKRRDKESQIILDWLTPLNFWEKQFDSLSRREVGTGQWILNEPVFHKWLDGTQRILWCPGMPGAGKTILASAVIDHLQNMFPKGDISIAFIYCSYKEQGKQTLTNLIASLLQQVLQKRPLPTKLHTLYQHHISTKTRPTVTEYLELLHTEISGHSRVYLVVDALDECDDSEARTILLNNLLKLPTNTSLMVTSRHLPSIETQMDQSCRLEIRARDIDIRIFLERQIQRKERLKRHTQKDTSLIQAILENVAKAVQGMFLLAQLHIDALSQKHSPKAVRKALQNLPEKLDETYDVAMERIRSQNKEDVDLAQRVLSWISFALRPLTIAEIRHAISVQPDQTSMDEDDLIDEEILVSVCAGLVVIDQESKVIRLIHYTTQDYFDRNRQTQFPDGQTDITKSCLTYLSFKVFQSGYCKDDEQLELRLQKYPLFRYVAQNWGDHARGDAEIILQIQILEFFARESELSSMAQAMQLPQYRYRGYSQRSPKVISGLWIAAMFGLSFIATKLLEGEVDLNLRRDHGETALLRAACSGHEVVVRLLLEKGADVRAKNNSGETALLCATWNRHEAVVRLLLEKGADVGAKNNSGETALLYATWNGHEAVVRLLLEKGADVEAKNIFGETVLPRAAWRGYEAVVRLLLEKGADIEVKDGSRETALLRAAGNGQEAVVRLLLEKGADVEAKNNSGETALLCAAWNGHEAVVRLLLDKGADIEVKDGSRETALLRAARNGQEAVVRLLLEKGADVEAKNNFGETALLRAAWRGYEAVVRLLLEKWADVEVKDGSGETALPRAARNGQEGVVRLLLEKGADTEVKNGHEKAALLSAADNEHETVI